MLREGGALGEESGVAPFGTRKYAAQAVFDVVHLEVVSKWSLWTIVIEGLPWLIGTNYIDLGNARCKMTELLIYSHRSCPPGRFRAGHGEASV